MTSVVIVLLPAIALVVGLIGVLIVAIITRKNRERMDRIVEGKESERHSNLPEVTTAVKGVSTALIIILLCINLFGVIGLYKQMESNNADLKQNVYLLDSRIEKLEDTIKESNCPYTDAQTEIFSVDEANNNATIKYTLRLKETSEDTKVFIEYTGEKNFSVELKRESGSLFTGTYEVDLFDTNIYEAALDVTSNGITKTYKTEDFNIAQIPVKVFSFYWINVDLEAGYKAKNNKTTLSGTVEATRSYGKIDNVKTVYVVYLEKDKEVERFEIDKNSENYIFDIDRSFNGGECEIRIETILTNGYSFIDKVNYNFPSEHSSSIMEKLSIVSPDGTNISDS